ncbi:DUF192 domain-containing protein [Rubrivirga sp. IMCC43871]|uniref:DUF192 domain-containing protein n=1 Tax=Rubrivirga sp. IMCC43871 TaxID=3391575 RepID=UPI00398FBA26
MRSALLVLTLLAAGCADATDPAPAPVDASPSGIPFEIDGTLSFLRGTDTLKTIAIEIADTDSTRGRGLMQRTDIPEDTGMLFIFPRAEPQAFYMANTPRSLDIQFYGADSTLLNVAYGTTPFSNDNLLSDGPTQFVVEVEAGVTRRLGLVQGDRITWDRD